MAAEFEILFVNDVEACGDDFGIGDAFGVRAAHKVLDVVGNFGVGFADDFVVLNVDDGRKGSYECYFADFVVREMFVLYFDDSFFAEFSAVEVVADKDFILVFFKTENADGLIDGFCGNVVDDGAVVNGRDDELLFIFDFA